AIVAEPNIAIGDWPRASFVSMQSRTLREVLGGCLLLDLVASDLQGSEMEVFCGSMNVLTDKVKRVHIGTHGKAIEEGLRQAFDKFGWCAVRDFSLGREYATPIGPVKFQDGVQTWVNPSIT